MIEKPVYGRKFLLACDGERLGAFCRSHSGSPRRGRSRRRSRSRSRSGERQNIMDMSYDEYLETFEKVRRPARPVPNPA